MASGFFLGGLGEGFESGLDTVGRAKYQAGLLQLSQQRQKYQEYQDARTEVTNNRATAIKNLQETISAFHNAHPDYTDLQIASNGGVSAAASLVSQYNKMLGMPDDTKAMVASMAVRPSDVQVARLTAEATGSFAKNQVEIEKDRAQTEYVRSGIPTKPGQPSGPITMGGNPGEGLGEPGYKRVAQVASPTATDVQADVGEQAGQQYLDKNVSPDEQELVKSIANYDTDPNKAVSARFPRGMQKGRREQLMEYAFNYAKAKGEEYKPRAFAVVQDFLGNGKHSDQVRSLNVITDHLQTLRDLGNALDNRDNQALNDIVQRWNQQWGKSAPTDFRAALQIVGSEAVKAIGVANAGSAEERQNLAKNLSVASGGKQINDAIDKVYGPLMSGQLKGLRNQFVTGGGPRERFDKALSQGAREFLDSDKKKKDDFQPSGFPGVSIRVKE